MTIPTRVEAQVSGFAPYATGIGSMGFDDIVGWCRGVAEANRAWGVTNPFDLYERLLDVLGQPQFDVVPLADVMIGDIEGRVRVSLRHDLDANLNPAFDAAAALRQRNMTGSFYPLHTSHYWCELREGVFCRQPGLAEAIGKLVGYRHEIGLHIDPLHLYFAHGVDGTAGVLSELAWLRSVAGKVTGVVAHNSAPVYGAENFEILKGLALAGRTTLTWNGVTAPLQTIDLTEQCLSYEGNHAAQPDAADAPGLATYLTNVPADALRRADWQAIYLLHNPVFARRNDVSVWLIGRDMWSIAEHRPIKRLYANIDTADTFAYLRRVPAGNRVVIVVHPEYIGG